MSVDATNSFPRTLVFTSNNVQSGTNSSFISVPVSLGENDYDSVVMLQCSIPRSYYNVPSTQNTFTLRELGVDATVTIPPGTYNKNSLQATLQTLLNNASASLGAGHSWSYTVSYPATSAADTYKYTFTVTGNSGQPSFIFANGSLSPFQQLGFGQNTTNTFSGSTLTSTNCINLLGVNSFFVTSNICQNAQSSILQGILSVGTVPMLGMIYFQQQDIELGTKEFNSTNTNSWQFSLTDSFGNIVDLNGVPWSFSLLLYKRSTTHEVMKSNLMIENEDRLFRLASGAKELSNPEAAPGVVPNILPPLPPPTLHQLFEQNPSGLPSRAYAIPPPPPEKPVTKKH